MVQNCFSDSTIPPSFNGIVNGNVSTSVFSPQLLLTEQTGIEPGSQVLLFEDNLLTRHVEPNTPGTSFPDTTTDKPVIMFSKNNNNVGPGDDR